MWTTVTSLRSRPFRWWVPTRIWRILRCSCLRTTEVPCSRRSLGPEDPSHRWVSTLSLLSLSLSLSLSLYLSFSLSTLSLLNIPPLQFQRMHADEVYSPEPMRRDVFSVKWVFFCNYCFALRVYNETIEIIWWIVNRRIGTGLIVT